MPVGSQYIIIYNRIGQFFSNTFYYRCLYKNDKKSIRKHDLILLENHFLMYRFKNLNGVQNFLGYKMMKWGTVPQNGVRLAPLPPKRPPSFVRLFPIYVLIYFRL